MTKGRMIIEFESEDIIADMNLSGDIAGHFARAELADLDRVKVTHLHVYKIEEVQVDLSPNLGIKEHQCPHGS